MKVESTTPKAKTIGTAAGALTGSIYIAKNAKDIFVERGKEAAENVVKQKKENIMKGVLATAENNLEAVNKETFINKMKEAVESLGNNKEAFREKTSQAAELLGAKKDTYFESMKNIPEVVEKYALKGKVKGIAISAAVSAGVVTGLALAGRAIGSLIGKAADHHKIQKAKKQEQNAAMCELIKSSSDDIKTLDVEELEK